MGIRYNRLLNMTWKEFHYEYTGYIRRIERNWDYVRNIQATQFNSSGFSKKQVKPLDIRELPHLDKKSRVLYDTIDPERLKKLIEIRGKFINKN